MFPLLFFSCVFPYPILSHPSELPIIAYQRLTGQSLPSCSISVNESVDERFHRLDRFRRRRLSFTDFLFADQCAIQIRKSNFDKIDTNCKCPN